MFTLIVSLHVCCVSLWYFRWVHLSDIVTTQLIPSQTLLVTVNIETRIFQQHFNKIKTLSSGLVSCLRCFSRRCLHKSKAQFVDVVCLFMQSNAVRCEQTKQPHHKHKCVIPAPENLKEPVGQSAGVLLDDCSFGASCCCEHDSGGEADPQVVLLQTQQLGTVLQCLTRLVLDGAASWKTMRTVRRRRENVWIFSDFNYHWFSRTEGNLGISG